MENEHDDIESFEAKETKKKLPLAWLLLFIGLIVWGIAYIILYSPATTGWTQDKALRESTTQQ